MPCSSDAGLFDLRLNVVDIVNTYRGRLGLLRSVSTQVTLETIHYAVLSAAHQPALSLQSTVTVVKLRRVTASPCGRYRVEQKAMVRGHAAAAMRPRQMRHQRTILQSGFCSSEWSILRSGMCSFNWLDAVTQCWAVWILIRYWFWYKEYDTEDAHCLTLYIYVHTYIFISGINL